MPPHGRMPELPARLTAGGHAHDLPVAQIYGLVVVSDQPLVGSLGRDSNDAGVAVEPAWTMLGFPVLV